jgi:hypothetical protein
LERPGRRARRCGPRSPTAASQMATTDRRFGRARAGGVTGEPLDDQPAALAADPALHPAAVVGGQAVPDQGHLGGVEFVVECVQELDQGLVVVGAGAGVETRCGPLPGRGRRPRRRPSTAVSSGNGGAARGCVPAAPRLLSPRGGARSPIRPGRRSMPGVGGAPFLSGASPPRPSGRSPRRRVPPPAGPAADGSSPACRAAASTRVQGGNALRSRPRSPSPPVPTSTDRCWTRAPAALDATPAQLGAVGARSAGASDRPGPPPSTPWCHRAASRRTSGSPTGATPPPAGPHQPGSPHGRTSAPPACDAAPSPRSRGGPPGTSSPKCRTSRHPNMRTSLTNWYTSGCDHTVFPGAPGQALSNGDTPRGVAAGAQGDRDRGSAVPRSPPHRQHARLVNRR